MSCGWSSCIEIQIPIGLGQRYPLHIRPRRIEHHARLERADIFGGFKCIIDLQSDGGLGRGHVCPSALFSAVGSGFEGVASFDGWCGRRVGDGSAGVGEGVSSSVPSQREQNKERGQGTESGKTQRDEFLPLAQVEVARH